MEMDDDNWVAAFLEELEDHQQVEDCGQVDGDSDAEDDSTANTEEPLPKLKTYKEAITSLEEVSRFLEYKGHGDEALSIGSTIERIVNLKHTFARQATLHDYFTQQ